VRVQGRPCVVSVTNFVLNRSVTGQILRSVPSYQDATEPAEASIPVAFQLNFRLRGMRRVFGCIGEIMLRNLGCIGPQLMELTPSRYCEVCGFMQGLSQFVPAILIPI
jgi:hypothetical protein